MGRLVHVIKKREVYGGREAFNWGYDNFVSLLEELGCHVYSESSEGSGLTRFETPKDNYKAALKLLEVYQKNGTLDEYEIDAHIDLLGGIENIIDTMRAFLKECDKKSEWIQFVVW